MTRPLPPPAAADANGSGERFRLSLAGEEPARSPQAGSGAETPSLSVYLEVPPGDRQAPFAILYMHGFGSRQDGEKALFFRRRWVGAGIPFCSFDFQGHGDSDGSMLGLTLGRNVRDAARVHAELARRGLPRVVVVGSSMGGLTGLWYAATRPDGVLAGLCVAPALGLERSISAWAGVEAMERWRREGSTELTAELGTWEVGWGLIEDLRAHRQEDLAARLAVPSLLLQGQRDDQVDWRRVAELAATATAPCELVLFGDGDHRLIDRTERLFELMLSFLQSRGLLPVAEPAATPSRAPAASSTRAR